jgi:signal transduction histidine kinase
MGNFRQFENSWYVRPLRRFAASLSRQQTPSPRAAPAAGPRLVDVNRALVTAAALFAPLMGDQIQLGLRVSPTRALVPADVMDVEHVLLTLALHARDEMPYGGMLVIESGVVAEPPHDAGEGSQAHVRVTISDTGSGEARTDGPLPDAPLTINPTADRTHASSFVDPGLVLAAATVRRMGGTLDIHREPFVGTTVTVRLPLAAPGTGR